MPETGNNTRNVTVGKPKIGGAVRMAPEGTTLPTTATEALSESWESMGYISEDGYSNSSTRETTEIVEWGGEVVQNPQTKKTDSFKMKFIEALRKAVLRATHGDDNVEGSLEDGMTIKVNAKELNSYSWIIDEIPNEYSIRRTIIPRGKITEIAEVVHKSNEVMGYDSTITAYAYPEWGGDTHREYLQEVDQGGGDDPTLKTLTVSSEPGTDLGATAITVSPGKETANIYVTNLDTAATSVQYDQDVQSWTTWDGESDITAEDGQVITVVEATADYKARGVGSATVDVR